MRHMLRLTTLLLSTAVTALGAQAPADTAARIDSVVREIHRLGPTLGDSIWPGYRPDTFAFLFVLPSRGAFLAGWRGELPAGFAAVAGHPALAWRNERDVSAASTSIELAGRPVAQVVLLADDGPYLVSTAFHEGFHVFERIKRREGQTFGEQENAFYLSTYPVFDADNEAAMALEGRLLGAALDARSVNAKRALAREFVAARRARHERVAPQIAAFDRASEMNEGLAEYALVRALRSLARNGPASWRPVAGRQLDDRRSRLDDLTGNTSQSIRLRYYVTGPAMAQLLDELDPSWKIRLMRENVDLQDALGHASGLDAPAERAVADARTRFHADTLRAAAVRSIAALQEQRRRKADSTLAAPGIKLVLTADSLPNKDFGMCGFDPQNQLPITPTVSMQTRWWKPCGGASTMAELNVPSVHDEQAGTVTAVIGPEAEVRITAAGQPVQLKDGDVVLAATSVTLDAPRATVQTARADLIRHGETIIIRPRP